MADEAKGQGGPAASTPEKHSAGADPMTWLIWIRNRQAFSRRSGGYSQDYTIDLDRAGRYGTQEALKSVETFEAAGLDAVMVLAPEQGAVLIAMLERPAEFVVMRAPAARVSELEGAFPGRTVEQWLPELRRMVDQVRADPPSIGVLSRGEQCAVALVLEPDCEHGKFWFWRPAGFTWLDCVARIEPELLEACIRLQRELS